MSLQLIIKSMFWLFLDIRIIFNSLIGFILEPNEQQFICL